MSFQKIIAAFLLFVLIGGVLTGCGANASLPPPGTKRIAADEARGIHFSNDKRTLVKYNRDLPETEYTIPGEVTAIGEKAFEGCFRLTNVTIPASVTSIGNGAFEGCESLTNMTIPASVISIGNGAFEGCGKVEFSSDNRNFFTDASGALFDRKNKTLLYFPPAFSGAYTIPDGVTAIGEAAFAGCESLTSVTIPAGVTDIGEAAFYECKNLTRVTIPASVTDIRKGAFAECKNLTRVTIPVGVTVIEDGAFHKCESLTSVTIPASVTDIGYMAFAECKSLARVTIPASVTDIGKEAFEGCPCETSVKKQFPNYR